MNTEHLGKKLFDWVQKIIEADEELDLGEDKERVLGVLKEITEHFAEIVDEEGMDGASEMGAENFFNWFIDSLETELLSNEVDAELCEEIAREILLGEGEDFNREVWVEVEAEIRAERGGELGGMR